MKNECIETLKYPCRKMLEMGFIEISCFQSFSIPKKLLVVHKSIKKIEFDCEMKMHYKTYDDDLNKKLFFLLRLNLKYFWSPVFNLSLFRNSYSKLGCNKCISNAI